MRGGGSEEECEEDDNMEETENYIRNANKDVLEKFYSGKEDIDTSVSCGAVYSDGGGLDIPSYMMGSERTWLQPDIMSEPSRKVSGNLCDTSHTPYVLNLIS
uniref:Uncharacterized protein n=1 Tax=Cacopsylla melanoneura TaxID=428564 RepID=A0A8D8SYC6_9HEMI